MLDGEAERVIAELAGDAPLARAALDFDDPVIGLLANAQRRVRREQLDRLFDGEAGVEAAVEAQLGHLASFAFGAAFLSRYFSSHDTAMPSGSSSASPLNSNLARSSSDG